MLACEEEWRTASCFAIVPTRASPGECPRVQVGTAPKEMEAPNSSGQPAAHLFAHCLVANGLDRPQGGGCGRRPAREGVSVVADPDLASYAGWLGLASWPHGGSCGRSHILSGSAESCAARASCIFLQVLSADS